MTLLARWRTAPPARVNDVAQYEAQAHAWWDDSAPTFAPLRAMARPRLEFLSRHGVPRVGARVVDVGAGGCYLGVELAARGARVVAVDIATHALCAGRDEHARRGGAPSALVVVAASATALPLSSAGFDVVLCADVLVHIEARALALDEIARITAPGGIVYIASMNRTALARFVLLTLGEDVLGVVPRGTHDAATFIKPGELDDEMRARGLALAAREGVGPGGVDGSGLTFRRSRVEAVMYHALYRRP